MEAKEENDYHALETSPLSVSRYDAADVGNGSLCCPNALSCIASTIIPIVWLRSCVTVEENSGLVVLVNGKLSASITEPGLHAGECVCAVVILRTDRYYKNTKGLYLFGTFTTYLINRGGRLLSI